MTVPQGYVTNRKKAELQTPIEILNSQNPTLSVDEVAKVLGVSRGTIYLNVRETGFAADGLPVIKIGSSVRISTATLRKWLDV
jgi:excisionase family DNA binding protein